MAVYLEAAAVLVWTGEFHGAGTVPSDHGGRGGMVHAAQPNDRRLFSGRTGDCMVAAACSIYATMLSSLTYVALPALIYSTDWVLYLSMLMIPAVAPLAIYGAMPFFRRINATTAYEYLDRRFSLPVRLFGSGLFTVSYFPNGDCHGADGTGAFGSDTTVTLAECFDYGGLVFSVLRLGRYRGGHMDGHDSNRGVARRRVGVSGVFNWRHRVGWADCFNWREPTTKMVLVNLDFGPDSFTTLAVGHYSWWLGAKSVQLHGRPSGCTTVHDH